MRKLSLGIFMFGLLFANTVKANLSISPFYVLFDANSPNRSDVVRVTNTSNEEKSYRIKLINYQQNEDGSYKEISEALAGNPFATPYIGYAPHETTLAPRQAQTIRIQRKAMAAAKDGEYVSHLLIQEMPAKFGTEIKSKNNEIKIDIRALYGVTIPIIIDKGNLNSSGKVTQAKVVNSNKNPYAEVMVKRSGNQSFWGTLVVKEGKEEIGRINNFKIFLSTPQRLIKIPLYKQPNKKVNLILIDARTDATISSQEI